MTKAALLHLLHLTDSTLPIGGFSHSAGLETYVQQGLVHDSPSAKAFITAMLTRSLPYTDGALVGFAHTAAAANDLATLLCWDDWCTAVKLPEEMRTASKKLGLRLIKLFEPLLSHALVQDYFKAVRDGTAQANYCIVFGLIAQVLGVAAKDTLFGFYYNAVAGMVTNAVKLVPLGQQEGQALLFSLLPDLETIATQSLTPDMDLLGLCCSGFDIRCMQHEQLYSRLYMS
jgi:urease accessory protein